MRAEGGDLLLVGKDYPKDKFVKMLEKTRLCHNNFVNLQGLWESILINLQSGAPGFALWIEMLPACRGLNLSGLAPATWGETGNSLIIRVFVRWVGVGEVCCSEESIPNRWIKVSN